MKYLYLILFFPAFLFSQNEISKPTRMTMWVAYDSINNVYHTGNTLPTQVTTSGQPSFQAATEETTYLGIVKDYPIQWDTLPAIGERVEQGQIYQWGDTLVLARQTHARTIFPPNETPALFVIYREQGDKYLEWIAGEYIYVGQRRTYNQQLYEVIQEHLTIIGQTPDLIPALWKTVSEEECPIWIQPTGAQDAYPVDACVTHEGQEWISITPANVWEPGVFGWILK